MDLWIRSQDGKLLRKADTLWVEEYEESAQICHGLITFGTYKSKERALEVLNNIQHWLIQVNDNKQQVIVYEMPKE